ncbi:MAG TPA: thiamine phosphate synthase [Bacillota bacterium]|nr:thiamine phosphate synthase [Bacillota bacterium]
MNLHQALRLYFIMGSQNTKADPETVLKQAIQGGITCFQYREKGSGAKTGEDRFHLGEKLRELCATNEVPFIVNDDIELARALDADGIHIGQGDLPMKEARKKIPSHMIIGLSTSTVEESIQAEKDGADYIGVGPIFATNSKEDALQPIHIQGLKEIREAVPSMPIVVIGGMNASNAKEAMDAGANGVSLISAISQATDVTEATSRLRSIV